MRTAQLPLLASLVVFALLAAPAAAQDQSGDAEDEDATRVDFSATVGGVMSTDWSNLVLLGSISSSSGVIEQVLTRDLHVDSNTAYSGAFTYWRGRYGFRTQVGFSRSSLLVGAPPPGGTDLPGSLSAGSAASVGLDTWTYDVRGAIGFLGYQPTRWIWPYGFFGLGGITYKFASPIAPPLSFIGSGPIQPAGGNTIVVAGSGQQFVVAIDELSTTETVFAFNFGIGTDFRIPTRGAGLGLRVELSDHLSPSPLQVQIHPLSGAGVFVPDTGGGRPLVHQLAVTAGVVVRIGG